MIAFLNSAGPAVAATSSPFPAPEAGTAMGANFSFALLLDAFASQDPEPLRSAGAGEPGTVVEQAANTPAGLASPEGEGRVSTWRIRPDLAGVARKEDSPEEAAAESTPGPEFHAEVILPLVLPVITTAAGDTVPEAPAPDGTESAVGQLPAKSLTQVKDLPPVLPAVETVPLERSAPQTKSSRPPGLEASTVVPPQSPSQDLSIEAFAVELVSPAPNEAQGVESTRSRTGNRAASATANTQNASSLSTNTDSPARAASAPQPLSGERPAGGHDDGEPNNHRREGPVKPDREIHLAQEQRATAHSGEHANIAATAEQRSEQRPTGTPQASQHESEPGPAQPASESVRQIEALRFGGVNLGRSAAVHDVEIRIPMAETPVDVKLTSRGGSVDVSVRVADPQLAQDLRAHLPRLIEALENRGYESNSIERRSETGEPQQAQPARMAYNVDSDHQQRRRDQQPSRSKSGAKRLPSDEVEEFRIEQETRIFR